MFCILSGLNPDLLEDHQQPQAQEDQNPRLHPLSGPTPGLLEQHQQPQAQQDQGPRLPHRTLVCMFSLISSHLAKQSSQPGSPTGPAGTACPSLPPSARPAPASIFDFRPLFQATDAVPCCCKRTTKSSVLSCRAASATATQMFAAIGLAPMVADPPASTGFAAS